MTILVGVGVFVIREDKFLLGKRKGSHGEGTWALPGGHLEFGETVESCASREVAEETGLAVTDIRHAAFGSNVFAAEGKHYITLFVEAVCETGEPDNLEPHKCDGWRWCHWSNLPSPLFPPLQSLIESGYQPGPGQ